MFLERFVVTCGLLAGLSSAARADLTDPDIGIDIGSQSGPIAVGTTFQPINGGGILDFFNATNGFITKLVFQVTVPPDLTFACNNPGGFFHNCSPLLSGNILTITFFGTDPQEPTEPPVDTEVGEFEGIPPLMPGCTNPHDPGCNGVGDFGINLNDFGQPTGTWPNVTFQTVEVDVTPEPSALLPLGAAVLLMFGLATRRLCTRVG
jgi:hypothetical protein